MNELNECVEPRLTKHLLCSRSRVQSHRSHRHNQVLRGHSWRERLREQPFRLLPLQLHSSVCSRITCSRFWDYFPNIRSIESATLVFLPWLMLLN